MGTNATTAANPDATAADAIAAATLVLHGTGCTPTPTTLPNRRGYFLPVPGTVYTIGVRGAGLDGALHVTTYSNKWADAIDGEAKLAGSAATATGAGTYIAALYTTLAQGV